MSLSSDQVNDCDLIEVTDLGIDYTWTNSKSKYKLDIIYFLGACLWDSRRILYTLTSDHYAMGIICGKHRKMYHKKFCFECGAESQG